MPDDDTRTPPTIQIRVTREELALIKKAASRTGDPRHTVWCRRVLLRAAMAEIDVEVTT